MRKHVAEMTSEGTNERYACPVWLTEEEGVACDVSGGQVAAGAHDGDAAAVAAVLDAASVGEGVAVGSSGACGVRGSAETAV